MSRLLLLLFLYVNYVFCISYNDYSESSASSEEEVAETKKHRLKECLLNVDRLNSPLVLSKRTANVIFPHKKTGIISVKEGKAVDIACPGHRNRVVLNGIKSKMKIVRATCATETPTDENYSWNSITCNLTLYGKAFQRYDSCAPFDGYTVDVNFDLASYRHKTGLNRYVRIYSVCFSNSTLSPLYTHNRLLANFNVTESSTLRRDRLFYDIDVKKVFTERSQRMTINAQLGLNATSKLYIKTDHRHVLAPTLLSTPKDFPYDSYQLATYRYINVVPRWQGLFNWDDIELDILNFTRAFSKNSFEVWTGAYGCCSLPRYYPPNKSPSAIEQVPLYLYHRDKKCVPVPHYLWKILYHRSSSQAVVFVVINNPYVIQPKPFCTDVSKRTGWLTQSYKENPEYGYAFTCSYNEFNAYVHTAPLIEASYVLPRRNLWPPQESTA